MRAFAILPEWTDRISEDFLPRRGTLKSAGYDLKAAEEIVIPSIWSQNAKYTHELGKKLFDNLASIVFPKDNEEEETTLDLADHRMFRATMVKTGMTAYMEKDEVLKLHVRSSIGFKMLMTLANSVGIIDADYSDKGGHIMIPMMNFGFKDRVVEKGEAICQGIFSKYLITDDDFPVSNERDGGFGSTNEKKAVK